MQLRGLSCKGVAKKGSFSNFVKEQMLCEKYLPAVDFRSGPGFSEDNHEAILFPFAFDGNFYMGRKAGIAILVQK